MDRKKLLALREKVEAVSLPETKGSYQYHRQDEAGQKALAAAATTAVGLLNKAKLARGAAHQKKLVELGEKLKISSTP